MLSRFPGSGQSVAAFCRAESISVGSYHRWRTQLRMEKPELGEASQRPAFLDLGALSAGSALTLELDFGGGVTLRVRRG
ncbi:MAG: IS66 family insertion sequence element accessory protein TnpA [Tepidisphaeraceae bacterium]